MARNFDNWLSAYCDLTAHLEAPVNLHFFSGVAAISGCLRRQVWFDQGYFSWFPNFYIIVVAKPGIATKSTSIGFAMDMVREVPGIHVGPSSITWQALIMHMSSVAEQVDIDGEFHTQSCLTFVASELGTLIDFHNREMIDVLVDLWDGKTGSWEKMTKMSGNETIVNPWISLIAGTTPAWLAANVPESAIGGGFTSRCLFVYGREKRHLEAYPKEKVPPGFYATRRKLIEDLEDISMLKGEIKLTPDCRAYGEHWYEQHWTNTPDHLTDPRFEGYVARKQTHIHKLSMILSAAQRTDRLITTEIFQTAEALLQSAEDDMILALDKVGRAKSSLHIETIVEYVRKKGAVDHAALSRFMTRFAEVEQIPSLLAQLTASGYLTVTQRGAAIIYQLNEMSV